MISDTLISMVLQEVELQLLFLPEKQREREKCNSASNQLSSFQIKLNNIMKRQCGEETGGTFV